MGPSFAMFPTMRLSLAATVIGLLTTVPTGQAAEHGRGHAAHSLHNRQPTTDASRYRPDEAQPPSGGFGLAATFRSPPALVSVGGIDRTRAALWGSFTAAGLYEAYQQSQASWGTSNGKFHFKNDFAGDGMALSDEVSHLFVAFQLTRAIHSGYRWIGFEPQRARRLAALEAWLLTFLVEYPIDAYNPDQGFGVSDLLFNTAGVLAAYQHTGQTGSPRWDVKISVKPQFFQGESRLIAHTSKQYDDYVYWITYRPSRSRYMPWLLGAGYSTSHSGAPGITKEIHLAVGTTLAEIGGMLNQRLARYLRPLDFFFFNIGTKITWQ